MAPKNPSKIDPIDQANAKSLVDFERDYLPPRYSYTPYVIPCCSSAREVDISLHTPETLSSAELTKMLDLIAKTCGALYRASTMGWNQRKKRGEMKLRDLKYLVVKRNGRGLGDREMSREREGKDVRGEEESGEKVEEHNEEVGKKRKRTADEDAEKETQKPKGSEEGEPLGFASFMPTYEDGKKVLYIYEIHLEEELRGTKLSQALMSLIQHAAEKISGVEKVMLTCFTANALARRFYAKLGYEVDEYSPQARVMRGGKKVEADYVILSRRVGE